MKIKIITFLLVAAILVVVLLATIPASAAPGAYVCNEGAGQDYMYFGRDSKNRDIARCFDADVNRTQLWRIVCSKSIDEAWVDGVVTASCTK